MNKDPLSAKYHILIVEDDIDLNNLLKFSLESSGDFRVDSHFTGEGTLEKILELAPHLVLLDSMLPHKPGLEILKEIRTHSALSSLFVVLLTARSREKDKIEGFELGADDYITKPFSPRELLLRLQALLRRTPSHEVAPKQEALRIGNIHIVPDEFKVFVGGHLISLTMTEYQLLLYLAEQAGKLQSRDLLLQKVWHYEGQVNTRTVDTHIKRLRQKLGPAGHMIETVHGFGYQLKSS